MVRTLVSVLLLAGLLLHGTAVEAKPRKSSKAKAKAQPAVLVNQDLTGSAWRSGVIAVENNSSYPPAEIAYALQAWQDAGAPQMYLQQGAPTPCTAVQPKRGTIILCDGVPWWTGDAPVGGFTANYTDGPVKIKNKKKKGKRAPAPVAAPAIQASVVWLFPPRWTDPGVLRYIPTHELGHALGLGEMTCDCVMSPIISDINVLTSDVVGVVNSLYSVLKRSGPHHAGSRQP
ncbi:MAG: hypothetical protein QM692_09790 [Thermomicrobiales bacterium]